MKSFKTLVIGSLAVITSFGLITSYDYFLGHKIITNESIVLSPAQVSAIASTTSAPVDTVTYANVNGTSNTRQLVKSPVEFSFSKDDKTPLIVSTGNGGANATYLAKFKNYALGEDKNMVLTVSNTGDLTTTGKIDADAGSFGSVDTGKVSLDGSIKFKSRANDPTKTDSGTKNKYGLLWLKNSGQDLYFMNSDDAKYKLLMETSAGRLGIGTNSPLGELDIYSGHIFHDGGTIVHFFNGYFDATDNRDEFAGYINDGYAGRIGFDPSSGKLSITTTSNNGDKNAAMTENTGLNITSAGDVGIGTNSPNAALDVRGDLYFGSGSGEDEQQVLSSDGSGLSVRLKTNGDIFLEGGLFKGQFGGTGAAEAGTTFYIDDAGNVGINTLDPTELLDIDGDTIRIRDNKTPASATASCNKGEVVWDTGFVYVCIADNTWKRSALSSW